MKRVVLASAVVLLAAAGAIWAYAGGLSAARPPIRVGLLHSTTGSLAISEASMVRAETLAVEELNARGGLLGRPIQIVAADGRSDPEVFAREAERLIRDEHVDVIFGCWTSDCRKAVVPVVERDQHLLVYPVAYEGLEESPNVVYTGAAPNQQVIPTVQWALQVLKAKRFYLVGSDGAYARSVNAIVKDQFAALGGEVVGETYLKEGTSDVAGVVAKIVAAKPDLVVGTIEGTTNVAFYEAFRQPGAPSATIPTLTFTVTELELKALPKKLMTHDYMVCNYFQSIDRPENRAFVEKFRARWGDTRVTSDALSTAYTSVMLWSQAVVEAETAAVREVLPALLRQSLDAPEGIVSVDRETQHTYRPFFVAKVREDGQADIVLALTKPIRPVPFPLTRTRREWEEFSRALKAGAPAAK